MLLLLFSVIEFARTAQRLLNYDKHAYSSVMMSIAYMLKQRMDNIGNFKASYIHLLINKRFMLSCNTSYITILVYTLNKELLVQFTAILLCIKLSCAQQMVTTQHRLCSTINSQFQFIDRLVETNAGI